MQRLLRLPAECRRRAPENPAVTPAPPTTSAPTAQAWLSPPLPSWARAAITAPSPHRSASRNASAYANSSSELACGDRRFCRDACNAMTESGAATPQAVQSTVPVGAALAGAAHPARFGWTPRAAWARRSDATAGRNRRRATGGGYCSLPGEDRTVCLRVYLAEGHGNGCV